MDYRPELALDTIFSIARDVSKQGGIVGFTHGAFDLFHISHLDLLQKAAKLCDVLFVGVEQDETVKGYKRAPIIPEQARSRMVNNVSVVTSSFIMPIVGHDNEARRDLYKELKVKKFFVGKNYFGEEKVRGKVEEAKAKFVKLETIQDLTTTNIIEKIVDNTSSNKKT